MLDSQRYSESIIPELSSPLDLQRSKEDMNIVIVGHVDHGKSTIIGRLLADTGSLPEGKLAFVQEMCRRNAKPFEYAFLLDALKDERAQGITIDTARCFFKTQKRDYLILDAPGHIEFLKNMVTGASRASSALLVIDAAEGVRENSRRHGYMLKMLGIVQVAVLVNKMDLVDYDEKAFNQIVSEYSVFLDRIGIKPFSYLPISGSLGDNITQLSPNMKWYRGRTVLETLDGFETEVQPEEKPFRLSVQGVYKFTQDGDTRRIVAGTIETGRIRVGDEVLFSPSGKKSRVATIESFNRPTQISSGAGWTVGFTLSEQIYIKRGEIVSITGQPNPKVASRIRTNLFWLGRAAMVPKKSYLLKLGSERVEAKLEKVVRVMDASTLESVEKNAVGRHDVAECILHLERNIAFDLAHEAATTSRFVIVDDYEIAGGGIILEGMEEDGTSLQENATSESCWGLSTLPRMMRTEKYGHRSALLLITGNQAHLINEIARTMEQRLFSEGRLVYHLDANSQLKGEAADIRNIDIRNRNGLLRRLAEISTILLDMGAIILITAEHLTKDDFNMLKSEINGGQIQVVWVGESVSTDIDCALSIPGGFMESATTEAVDKLLKDRNIILGH